MGQGTLASGLPPQNSLAQVCSAIPAIRTATLLHAYRGGLIEINEKEENADRITAAALDWQVMCRDFGTALSIDANAKLQLSGYGPIEFFLNYRILDKAMRLQEVIVKIGQLPAKPFVFSGLELRPAGQKRGVSLNADADTSRPGIAKFQLESFNERTGLDAILLLRNSQWMDFPLTLENRKFILALELPVPQTLMPQ